MFFIIANLVILFYLYMKLDGYLIFRFVKNLFSFAGSHWELYKLEYKLIQQNKYSILSMAKVIWFFCICFFFRIEMKAAVDLFIT